MTKNAYKIAKTKFYMFVEELIKRYGVYAPVAEEPTRFAKLSSPRDICILPNRTERSLKGIFFPPEERIYAWRRNNGGIEIRDLLKKGERKIVLGARGCDVRAIMILDRYMMDEFHDPYYMAERDAIIIGMTCEYPRDSCFCTAFGGMIPEIYDLWLTDIGEYYLVQVGSDEAGELISLGEFVLPSKEDIERAERKIRRIEEEIAKRSRINLCETKRCSQNIKRRAEHPMWEELGSICLCCGKCNFVCPTCHCFDIRDVVSMDGSHGERVRVWDSCHLYEYARTSAENFREGRDSRVRYRIYDKFVYPVMRYGTYACTGCGRCTDVCPAGIDIKEVLRGLIA